MSQILSMFGGGQSDQQNFPPFMSAGGVTPNQSNLGLWDLLQGLLGQGNLFATSGLGHSTMATQGAGGAQMGAAKALTGMSDANQEAQYQDYKNQIQNTITAQNQSNQSLDNLAQLVGFGGNAAGAGTAADAGGTALSDIAGLFA